MSKRQIAAVLLIVAVAAPTFAQPRNDDQSSVSVVKRFILKIKKIVQLDMPVITVPNP